MHQGRDVLYARLTYCLYLRPLASCCCCRVILLSAADVGMSVLLLVRKPTHSPAGRDHRSRARSPSEGLSFIGLLGLHQALLCHMCAPRPQLYIEHASCEYARGAIPRGTHASGIRLFLSHRKHTYQLSPSGGPAARAPPRVDLAARPRTAECGESRAQRQAAERASALAAARLEEQKIEHDFTRATTPCTRHARQSQDHQVAYVSCGAARARDPHMSTQLSRQNKRRHTTRCSSTAAAQALALFARGLPALAHVFAEARSWSPCCRRHHSRMMPGRRSSSQLAPSKLIAPSSPPCTAPPLALPVWPAWTASREREGGGKRLKATNPRNKRENGQKEWHESTQTSEADGRGLGEVC